MRAKRLDRKKLIQERKLLKSEVKNLETELAAQEAAQQEITNKIEATQKAISEKKARLAALERDN